MKPARCSCYFLFWACGDRSMCRSSAAADWRCSVFSGPQSVSPSPADSLATSTSHWEKSSFLLRRDGSTNGLNIPHDYRLLCTLPHKLSRVVLPRPVIVYHDIRVCRVSLLYSTDSVHYTRRTPLLQEKEKPSPPKSRPQTWDMGFGDVDDDYDPARPNDYMEYCRERINKKKQEERDRELKILMEEQEREVGTGRGRLACLCFPPPHVLSSPSVLSFPDGMACHGSWVMVPLMLAFYAGLFSCLRGLVFVALASPPPLPSPRLLANCPRTGRAAKTNETCINIFRLGT